MLFKISNLNSNLALTLGYLNLALNNSALVLQLFASTTRKENKKLIKGWLTSKKKDNVACFLFYCGGMLNIDHRKFLSQYNGPLFNIEWIFKEFKTQGNTPNWFSPMKKNNYLILIRKLIWREHVFFRLN